MFNKRSKGVWLLLLLAFLGAIVGSLIGDMLSKNGALHWMADGPFLPFSFSFGLNFVTLAMEGALKANVMSIIGIIVGVIVYFKL